MIPLRVIIDTNVVVSADAHAGGDAAHGGVARDDQTCTVVCLGCNRGGICRGPRASATQDSKGLTPTTAAIDRKSYSRGQAVAPKASHVGCSG
jgi:hypothetical protein